MEFHANYLELRQEFILSKNQSKNSQSFSTQERSSKKSISDFSQVISNPLFLCVTSLCCWYCLNTELILPPDGWLLWRFWMSQEKDSREFWGTGIGTCGQCSIGWFLPLVLLNYSFHLLKQIPVSLCKNSCDACKHPNLLAKYLGELTSAVLQKNHFSQIFIR